jgi:aspartyl-tRNA(Asn)/glutamyl-tRNA(Gln) amidotransferase subunit C
MGDLKQSEAVGIDVAYVAHLARLHLDEVEIATLQPQMEEIVGLVKKIDELDLSGVEPSAHATEVVNVLREDVPKAVIEHDRVMANAPLEAEDRFVVPKILE